MAGHRGIHQRWGLGGCREVIPGTEQSTLPLTRRFPWRVAKSHLRKDDMMALGRPMEAAGRCSVGRLQNCTTVRILSSRRDKNSDQCGSDEEQEPIHPKNPYGSLFCLQRVAKGVLKKSRQSYFHQLDR